MTMSANEAVQKPRLPDSRFLPSRHSDSSNRKEERPSITDIRCALALMAATLIMVSPHVAAKEFSVAGGYGFDWLKPKAARCLPISDTQAKKFLKCEFVAAGNAFGLASTYHMCTAPGRSEYLVYETKAKCVEALETMKANGP